MQSSTVEKGFVHFLFLILIVGGIIAGVILLKTKTPQIFKSKASNETSTCYAADTATLQSCMNKVKSGRSSNVTIAGMIDCTNSQQNSCSFSLSHIDRKVSIIGKEGFESGFKRKKFFNYNIFNITNSSNIILQNLIFDDDFNQGCPGSCNAPVAVTSSQNINLEKLIFKRPKPWAVSILSSSGVTVQNSQFLSAEIFGVWIPSTADPLSDNIHIDNNYFEDTRSTAITIGGVKGNYDNSNTISGNTFVHNHCDAVFKTCGTSGNEPCSGGQFVVETKTDHLLIENNIVKDGILNACKPLNEPAPSDLLEARTNGIEFTFSGYHDVIVRNNIIHDVTGTGIVANVPVENVSNITISGNKLYNIGLSPIVFPGANIVGDNCSTENCGMTGQISASPNPCLVSSAGGMCTSTITWTTNNALNVQLKVGGTGPFAASPSGSKDAPWISQTGALFELYSGDRILDRLLVKGQSTTTGPNPAPEATPVSESLPVPNIENGGVVITYNPWAVWLKGTNFSKKLLARAYDQGSKWGGDIPIVLGSDGNWLSLQLPANSPPSKCNLGKSCTVTLILVNSQGVSSNEFLLTLPPN